MRWFWKTFDTETKVEQFLNKHNMLPSTFHIIWHTEALQFFLFYYADHELER